VKGWLSWAVAHSVAVGEDSRNRLARWALASLRHDHPDALTSACREELVHGR
jgi:hypothetical protein